MRIAVATLAILVSMSGAFAQMLPDIENGRYSMLPVGDGVVRLDTRTGAVSTCSDKGGGWACTIIPDERAAYDAEVGRLLTANAALKAELAQRNSAKQVSPTPDAAKPDADKERKLEIPLPSERDVDRMMSFVESAWRKLVDIATRMQRESGGKI